MQVTREKIERIIEIVEKNPEKYPGMSYSEGILESLKWVLSGEESDMPFDLTEEDLCES